jgi:GNAT superfamily N-acetyltransferase
MAGIRVREMSAGTVADLAWFCVPPERQDDPAFRIGARAKEVWIREKLARGEPAAKIAYLGAEPAGILHYEPVPDEGVVHIRCVFVPHERHWRKGVGNALLAALEEEMRRPQGWNQGRPAMAITTEPFDGGHPSQLPAREFFLRRGFQPVGDDPDFLVLLLQAGGRYQRRRALPVYLPQEEDAGQILILHGPSFCPWAYPFHVNAAQVIQEIAPGTPVRWLDRSSEPREVAKRGGYEGIVVNRRPLRSFVLDREEFAREVREALRR